MKCFLQQIVPQRFELISFGTDKLIILWEVYADDSLTNRVGQIATQSTPNCMCATIDGEILMGCQDRRIRSYCRDITGDDALKSSYKVTRTFKEALPEKGVLSKVLCL